MDIDKLDFFTDPNVIGKTNDYLAELRAKCPVLREPFHGAVMVTGYDEAMEVFNKQGSTFSSCIAVTGPLPPLPFVPEGDDLREQLTQHLPEMPWTDHLVTFDGAEHMAHRQILTQLLTHSRLKRNEEYVRGLIERLIDKQIDRGGCEITKDYAHALSTLVIADLLGVPEEERDELVELLGLPPTQIGGDTEHYSLSDPLSHLHDRFKRYLLERKERPRDDMLTDLVQSRYRDGSEPDIDVLVRLACFMFGAGQDTSARLIAFSFRILGENPELQARLRNEPHRIPDFIEEALRVENPVKTLSRLAVTPTEIGGVDIPAGSIVTINVGGANRDPRHFADPDSFDIDRPCLRDHISFSRGAHACAGAPLARMEARVTLERFLARTQKIRISEKEHGPPDARRYALEPTYLLHGLQALHVEWDKA
jgi:cytochrome P450